MAVARDGTPVTGSVNGGDSFTLSLSTTGTNRIVIVAVTNSNSSVTTAVPTATGLTFTRQGIETLASNGTTELWWALAASQLSSTTITVTASPTGNFPQLTGLATAYSGVNTSTPFDGSATVVGNAGSNGSSQSITTTVANDLVIGAVGVNATPTIVAGTGQQVAGQLTNSGSFSQVALLEQTAATGTPGSVTMSFTLSGNSNPNMMIVSALQPSGGTSTTAHNLTLLGVGS